MEFDKHRVGFVFGGGFGALALVWTVLAAFGMPALYALRAALGLLFINPDYRIQIPTPFWGFACVIWTAALGYLIGWLAAAGMNFGLAPARRAPAAVKEPGEVAGRR